jgi:hypothetical protein
MPEADGNKILTNLAYKKIGPQRGLKVWAPSRQDCFVEFPLVPAAFD